jgi:RNA polymerase sigma-70 factor (ECF subfamily)
VIRDSQISDGVLIRRISQGDRDAFVELYQQYSRSMLIYLDRLVWDPAVAEELLQDLFLVVWKDAGRFRGRASVRTWLHRIAHNLAVSWLRKRRPEVWEEFPTMVDNDPTPEAETLNTVRREQIMAALEQLSPDHRAVVELAFFHQMRYREIAQVMDCPVGTVKSRMSHARRRLGAILRLMGVEGPS